MQLSWKRNLIMLWASQFMIMSGFSAMVPFVPLYFKNGLNITEKGELAFYVTMFNLCGSLAYAIFLPIWGKLSDRFGVKIMLLRGTFFCRSDVSRDGVCFCSMVDFSAFHVCCMCRNNSCFTAYDRAYHT